MKDNERQLAIIKSVGFGCRDVGRPVLHFSTYISEAMAALQVFELEGAGEIIEDSGVYDIKDLNGKPCWVEVRDNTINFIKVAKI